MKAHQITLYLWEDLRTEICKEMGIEEKYFRDYHKLVGGEYKDLWHEWIKYFDTEVRNDSTIDFHIEEEEVREEIIEDGKEWLLPMLDAVVKLWNKYNITHIRYCW